MNSCKMVSIFLVLAIMLGLSPFSIMETNIASAQGTPGIFEGNIAVQGAYLQAINTYPGVTPTQTKTVHLIVAVPGTMMATAALSNTLLRGRLLSTWKQKGSNLETK